MHLEGDETLLSGLFPDKGALPGPLERLRDLNPTPISVTRGDPPTQHSDKEGKPSCLSPHICSLSCA